MRSEELGVRSFGSADALVPLRSAHRVPENHYRFMKIEWFRRRGDDSSPAA